MIYRIYLVNAPINRISKRNVRNFISFVRTSKNKLSITRYKKDPTIYSKYSDIQTKRHWFSL